MGWEGKRSKGVKMWSGNLYWDVLGLGLGDWFVLFYSFIMCYFVGIVVGWYSECNCFIYGGEGDYDGILF